MNRKCYNDAPKVTPWSSLGRGILVGVRSFASLNRHVKNMQGNVDNFLMFAHWPFLSILLCKGIVYLSLACRLQSYTLCWPWIPYSTYIRQQEGNWYILAAFHIIECLTATSLEHTFYISNTPTKASQQSSSAISCVLDVRIKLSFCCLPLQQLVASLRFGRMQFFAVSSRCCADNASPRTKACECFEAKVPLIFQTAWIFLAW